ncbi:hypothetical protein ABFS82_02G050600 [Erythranthe guttata]|uniref:DUF7026 domain-containing protein n=1 Tax=Erythranthe guttata TaxID=4155 RepID=A0A022PVV0_ERYGU|nr:PREDICTED: uncharacterized protein LOC105949542 [Erythranthe guttata]EYU18375.1 hypothetical protein MIMGU_mgv1a014855mg [Erythranthe guttata]|eukprot:XP_012828297.1 PREDICTED: uncharacterized protein LOC105949542 [Erythranthe guttata]
MIPIKATAATMQTLPPNFQKQHSFPISTTLAAKPICSRRTLKIKIKIKIKCSKEKEENLTDETLAAEIGVEIEKLKSRAVQREEALKKSRELLFAEMCGFAGLKSDELKKKWRRMSDEERCDLAKGFVGGWSAQFHPLSAKSVKEMVELHLLDSDSNSSANNLFPDFAKFLGFPLN